MKCHKCGIGYTGYVVKKKGKATSEPLLYYYYKCRTAGCNCNKRTEQVNHDFEKFLNDYQIKPYLIAPLLYQMNHAFDSYEWVVTFSSKLNTAWASGSTLEKEKNTESAIPGGVSYFHEKGAFRTGKVNEVFEAIPRLNCIPEDDKTN